MRIDSEQTLTISPSAAMLRHNDYLQAAQYRGLPAFSVILDALGNRPVPAFIRQAVRASVKRQWYAVADGDNLLCAAFDKHKLKRGELFKQVAPVALGKRVLQHEFRPQIRYTLIALWQ